MELPDPCCSIPTSTHEPDTATNTSQRHALHCYPEFSAAAVRKRWWIMIWFYFTFHLSGRTGCCRLCPVWGAEGWRALHTLRVTESKTCRTRHEAVGHTLGGGGFSPCAHGALISFLDSRFPNSIFWWHHQYFLLLRTYHLEKKELAYNMHGANMKWHTCMSGTQTVLTLSISTAQYVYSRYLDWRRSTQSELLASDALWICAADHFKERREMLLVSLTSTHPPSSSCSC